MIRTRKQLIEAAEASPRHTVTRYDGRVLVRRHGGGLSLFIYPDGSAHRADIRLDLATKLRTVRAQREVLGL